jgi:hypothetical protein
VRNNILSFYEGNPGARTEEETRRRGEEETKRRGEEKKKRRGEEGKERALRTGAEAKTIEHAILNVEQDCHTKNCQKDLPNQ